MVTGGSVSRNTMITDLESKEYWNGQKQRKNVIKGSTFLEFINLHGITKQNL